MSHEKVICEACKSHPIAPEYGYEKHCKSCGDDAYVLEVLKNTIYLINK